MEMIPDQKPPPPQGASLKAKLIFVAVLAVFVAAIGVYLKYPPLKRIGEVRMDAGIKIPVYLGELAWSDELESYQKNIFVWQPETVTANGLAGIALTVCNMARQTRGVFGNRYRVAPNGQITVRFVQGGRYFYRLYPSEDLLMEYDTNSCSFAPYFAAPLENWRIKTAQISEISGKKNLRLGLRWQGDGPMDTGGFPFQDVCEMILQSPPIQIRGRLTDDIATIGITLERPLDLPLLDVYTWSGIRFQRVKNLCLEIGPVEEA